MHERGTTPEHFATIAAKNWNYGAACPFAHRRSDHVVTAEEVLAARMVAEPLTTMMCCPPDDGAACIIVAREDLVRSAPAGSAAGARAGLGADVGDLLAGPHLRRSGRRPLDHDEATRRSQCYEAAGLGPEDVSVAYCHDAFVNEELEYYELLGFCAEGEAEKLVVEGETGPGGRIPFNTDGGLIARGHPGGPTGDGHAARGGAAAAGRGGGPPGRGRPGGAGPPRRAAAASPRSTCWVWRGVGA